MRTAISLPIVVLGIAASCADYSGDVAEMREAVRETVYSPYTLPASHATRWAMAVLNGVRIERISGNAATRMFAVTGVAIYESVVGGMDRNRPLAGQLK